MNTDEQYSHAEIIDQWDFRQIHLIDAHVSSNTTLLQQRENTLFTSDTVSKKGDINGDHPTQQEHKTFPTMLKLISGSLVGGADFSEIYIDPCDEDKVNLCSDNNNSEGKGTITTKEKYQPCQK
jgi:hypothetical protein